jgi:hypothetical protein
MEFPNDVLGVIREFSKPLLRYSAEYKEAIRVLEMNEWPELKSKLSSKEADEVVPLLKIYIHDYKEMLIARNKYVSMDDFMSEEYDAIELWLWPDYDRVWEEYERLNDVFKASMFKTSYSLSELKKQF